MKLSFKIMTALFIFAVIGITSCTKNQFGLEESKTIDMQEIQQNIPTEMVIANLEQKEGIKIIEDYFHAETGVTGTLYEYVNFEGVTMQVLKAYKKPENIEEKGWLPNVYSVAKHLVYGDNGLYYEYRCDGSQSGCFGWANFWLTF